MLTLIAVLLIGFGGFIFSFAFRRGGRVVAAILLGGAIIALGFAILPRDREPIELPDNVRR